MKKAYDITLKRVKQYIDWAINNRFKGFGTIVLFGALIFFILFISTPKLKANEISNSDLGLASEVIEEIEMVTNLGLPLGEIMVTENDSLELYFDTSNSNIRIRNKENDISWNTTFNSTRAFEDLETYEIDAMSLINITYFGYDNSSDTWNVFENSVIPGNYKANKIENGIQLVFDVRDVKSVNLFEFIPQEISKERFETLFIDGIENSSLIQSDKNGIVTSFNYCYRYNEEKDNYYYRLASTPQLAMINYLILAMETVEYTKEDLISDNSAYGIQTYFDEKPHFEVTLELTLDEDDFIVNVPTGAIKNISEYFEIVNIEVLPNLGGADYRYKTGYTFIPDGSGAIMNLDSYQDAYPRYMKPVYDNNLYFDIYNDKEYSKDIEMPVFGMTYKKGGTAPMQGYFGIIETGEELAYINTQVSDGYSMNQSFSSFDTIQDAYLKIFGPYAIQTNVFRSETPFNTLNYQVRYKLLDEETSNYYSMSQIYRDYLIEKYDVEKKTTDNTIHLDVLGSVTIKDRFIGIPYDRISSYTTVRELNLILTSINTNASVNYIGALNNGVKNDLYNKVSVVRELEKEMKLETLLETYEDIYLGINLTRSYSNENGMRNKYAIHDFYGEPLEITQYNEATKQFEDEIVTTYYRVVSPSYLEDLTKKYLHQTDGMFNNVMINDLGSDYYVDYNRNNYVSGLDASNLSHEIFNTINAQQNIILSNPFIEYIQYTNMVTDISRESSNYGGFTTSVPFKQLVFNDLLPFTTESMNYDTSLSNEYYLLQYAELGAIPKFFVSYNNTVDLKVTEYNYYYSIQFRNYLDDISKAVEYLAQFDNQITDKRIINHEVVGSRIYLTTYSNGEQVYVNYNDYEVTITLDDNSVITLDSFDYYID